MHDYARSVQHNKQRQEKKPRRPPLPIWLIPLTLLMAGALAFGLYKLTSVPPALTPAATPEKTVSSATKPKQQAKVTPKPKPLTTEEQYDFYTLLPESEVITPRVEEYSSKKADITEQQFIYLLQAGSFRSAAEADKLRANLLLKGLKVDINKITNQDGSVWHRVLVGPFTSRSNLNHAQDILANANTESMIIKVAQ